MGLGKILNKISTVDGDDFDTTGEISSVDDSFVEQDSRNKMILLEPRAYSESQQIADFLKNNNSVVVNLKRVTPEQAKRIVDFLSGTLYAIDGDLQKLGGGIFLCTPKSVNVEGSISDETMQKPKSKSNNDDEDFNF